MSTLSVNLGICSDCMIIFISEMAGGLPCTQNQFEASSDMDNVHLYICMLEHTSAFRDNIEFVLM